jgi:hypothetical protein
MADASHAPPERRSLLREPLLHFVVLGVLIFVGQRLLHDEPDEDVRAPIVITDHLRETLAADRHRRVGERPQGEDLDALVASYVRDEALYREALRLGLDRGDTIVRRRLVQKMEFVLQGAAEVPEPTDDELRAFVEAHADAFRAPTRVAYEHVFVSRDARGDSLAEDAAAVMEALAADPESGESLGDPFIAGRTVALSTEAQIAGRMGVEFAAAVTAAPEDEWAGPFESSYGLHAVRVTRRETARMRGLDEVHEAALRGWLDEARAAAAEEAIREIVAEYPVEGAAP